MATLRELAAAAAADPKNPAYDPSKPVSSGNPFNYEDLQRSQGSSRNNSAGVTSSETGEPLPDAPQSPSPPSPVAGNSPLLNAPGTPPTEQTPDSLAAPTNVPGAKLLGGGGPAGPDPMETWATGHQNVREAEQGVLAEQGKSVERQRGILQSGMDEADKMRKQAQIDDVISGASVESLRLKSQHDAAARQEEIDKRAAAIRQEEQNPPNWFKERGTAGSILAAISMAAGAFAAAMPHTNNNTNQAADIINKSIDREAHAHEKKIDGMWKDLNFKAGESEKQYVHDQYFINQERQTKLEKYSHAMAMVDSQIQSTNNQSAIEGLTGLKTQLGLQVQKLNEEGVDQRLQVALYKQKQAQAGAAANPYSGQNATKAYLEYVKHTMEQNSSHPDHQADVMPENEWIRVYQGQGHQAGAAGPSAEFGAGVENVGRAGTQASQANVGDWILSNLPSFMAPGANMAMQHQQQYNAGILPAATRLLGDRMQDPAVQKQIEAFRLNVTDPDSVKADKIEQFKNFLRTNSQITAGKKGPTPP